MLCNKNQNENGIVAMSYSVELAYTKRSYRKGQEITAEVRKTAKLDIDPKYGDGRDGSGHTHFFGQVLDFQQSGNKIMREVHKLLKEGQYLTLTIVASRYEHVEEYTDCSIPGHPVKSTLKQLAFNCWKYEGDGHAESDGYWEGDKDEPGGLHIEPDTRYTDETHDMVFFWGQDILKALAEAGI